MRLGYIETRNSFCKTLYEMKIQFKSYLSYKTGKILIWYIYNGILFPLLKPAKISIQFPITIVKK